MKTCKGKKIASVIVISNSIPMSVCSSLFGSQLLFYFNKRSTQAHHFTGPYLEDFTLIIMVAYFVLENMFEISSCALLFRTSFAIRFKLLFFSS